MSRERLIQREVEVQPKKEWILKDKGMSYIIMKRLKLIYTN